MTDNYDRIIGLIDGLPDVTKVRPTTVTTVTPMLGNSQTYVVQTYRSKDDGYTVFLQMVDAEGRARVVIPPKVAQAIYRQRDALVARARKETGKRRWEGMSTEQREAQVSRLQRKPA
jgi:hypothetical protein